MLFCCKEKANKAWKTKPKTATVISLQFWDFLMYPELKGYFQEDNFWLQQPEFILLLLSYLKFVNPSEV